MAFTVSVAYALVTLTSRRHLVYPYRDNLNRELLFLTLAWKPSGARSTIEKRMRARDTEFHAKRNDWERASVDAKDPELSLRIRLAVAASRPRPFALCLLTSCSEQSLRETTALAPILL